MASLAFQLLEVSELRREKCSCQLGLIILCFWHNTSQSIRIVSRDAKALPCCVRSISMIYFSQALGHRISSQSFARARYNSSMRGLGGHESTRAPSRESVRIFDVYGVVEIRITTLPLVTFSIASSNGGSTLYCNFARACSMLVAD